MLSRTVRIADENDFPEMTEVLPRNRLQLREQTFADDGYRGPGNH